MAILIQSTEHKHLKLNIVSETSIYGAFWLEEMAFGGYINSSIFKRKLALTWECDNCVLTNFVRLKIVPPHQVFIQKLM